MANTGYGAVENVDENTAAAVSARSTANEKPGTHLEWSSRRKPWVNAYSCASKGITKLGDTSTISLSELYHTT